MKDKDFSTVQDETKWQLAQRYFTLFAIVAIGRLLVIPTVFALVYGFRLHTYWPLGNLPNYFRILLEVSIYFATSEVFFKHLNITWKRLLLVSLFVILMKTLNFGFETILPNLKDVLRRPLNFSCEVAVWYLGASFINRLTNTTSNSCLELHQLTLASITSRLKKTIWEFLVFFCLCYLIQNQFQMRRLYQVFFSNYEFSSASIYSNFGWFFALPILSIILATFAASRARLLILIILTWAYPVIVIFFQNPFAKAINYLFLLIPLFCGGVAVSITNYKISRSTS